MAFKKKQTEPGASLYRAREGFIYQGDIVVGIGDVAEDGHPILKGREHLFEPVTARFSLASAQPIVEPEPAADPAPEPAPEVEPIVEPEAELMPLLSKRIAVVTDGSGVFSATVRGECVLRAVQVTLGTLSTPDIAITSEPAHTSILAVAGLAADALYFPVAPATGADGTLLEADTGIDGVLVPFVVPDRMEIAITGGGNAKTGEIKLLYER